ncbi:MAG: carotenoid biosynthesis protein [Verrucomicrobia bacterium]|nr:carotenoid biosynthesis protein [Verrucomicrobiota bacterium]
MNRTVIEETDSHTASFQRENRVEVRNASSTDRLLGIAAAAYLVCYIPGLLIQTTNIFPSGVKTPVPGLGECVCLSLAGVCTALIIRRDCDARKSLQALFTILAGGAIAVMIGLLSGYPFGACMFTEKLGPRLFGLMPWIMPVCWLIAVINAYVVCSVLVMSRLSQPSQDSQVLLALLTAVTVTVMDMNYEPVAASVKQYIHWQEWDRAYYGVPRLNFFGWFTVSLILASILSHILDPKKWRLSTAWMCLGLLATFQLLLSAMNWQAHQYAPVMIALNLTGILAIGLACLLKDAPADGAPPDHSRSSKT